MGWLSHHHYKILVKYECNTGWTSCNVAEAYRNNATATVCYKVVQRNMSVFWWQLFWVRQCIFIILKPAWALQAKMKKTAAENYDINMQVFSTLYIFFFVNVFSRLASIHPEVFLCMDLQVVAKPCWPKLWLITPQVGHGYHIESHHVLRCIVPCQSLHFHFCFLLLNALLGWIFYNFQYIYIY